MIVELFENRVLIEVIPQSKSLQKTKSGIILPTDDKETTNEFGIVVNIGDSCNKVNINEKVFFDKLSGRTIKFDDKILVIMRETEILGKVIE
jgi:co-chaperonin GroES (HSP10)